MGKFYKAFNSKQRNLDNCIRYIAYLECRKVYHLDRSICLELQIDFIGINIMFFRYWKSCLRGILHNIFLQSHKTRLLGILCITHHYKAAFRVDISIDVSFNCILVRYHRNGHFNRDERHVVLRELKTYWICKSKWLCKSLNKK